MEVRHLNFHLMVTDLTGHVVHAVVTFTDEPTVTEKFCVENVTLASEYLIF